MLSNMLFIIFSLILIVSIYIVLKEELSLELEMEYVFILLSFYSIIVISTSCLLTIINSYRFIWILTCLGLLDILSLLILTKNTKKYLDISFIKLNTC